MTLTLRSATDKDLPNLAQMNKRLIEDEGSRNPMSVEELQARMAKWTREDWKMDLFMEQGSAVGYAVYQLRKDEYDPDRNVVYLRQMYLEREYHNLGVGTNAL